MILTHSYPDGNVASWPQVGHEDDRDDIADLVHGSDDARDGAGDLVPLLDGRDHRVEIPGAQGLLQRDKDWQQQHEDLKLQRIVCLIGLNAEKIYVN